MFTVTQTDCILHVYGLTPNNATRPQPVYVQLYIAELNGHFGLEVEKSDKSTSSKVKSKKRMGSLWISYNSKINLTDEPPIKHFIVFYTYIKLDNQF